MNNRDELFVEAAKNGEIEQLQQLMAHIEPRTKTTDNAIRWALRNGHTQCVKILAPMCLHLSWPSVGNGNFRLGTTPLMLAAEMGHLECLEFLLPLSNPRDQNSQALWRAAENGHIDCLNVLLPLSCPKTYHFALSKTIESGHIECAQILLDAIVKQFGSLVLDPIEQFGGGVYKYNFLSDAVRFQHRECFDLFLKVCDPKSYRSLALVTALIYGRKEYVEILKDLSDVQEALISIRQYKKMPTDSNPSFWLDFEAQWIKQKLNREIGEVGTQVLRKM